MSYLERSTAGGIDAAAELLADDFDFEGPMMQARGKRRAPRWSVPTRADHAGAEMRKPWVGGDDVCAVYDFKVETPLGAGSIPMAGWTIVRDGRIASSRLLLDTAAMAPLMTPS